jgi:Protein of unknown function (DUF3606)
VFQTSGNRRRLLEPRIRVAKLDFDSAIAGCRRTIHIFVDKRIDGLSDNPHLTASDRDRINVHQNHELRYWAKEIGVTPEILKDTVQKVSVMVADVRRELSEGA